MPRLEVFRIHPLGWENDPGEERYRLSTFDHIVTCTYNTYALYFRLDDTEQKNALEGLRHGLARTLGQARHLCGTLEVDPDGNYSFVRKRASTVELHVQWLDGPSDANRFPSLHDLEKLHFTSLALGDIDVWSVPTLTYGLQPKAKPAAHPVALALKANFVRGGLLLNTHMHHYANDAGGTAGFLHQLAENCRAFLHETPYPPWDPACLDVSRFSRPDVPDDQKIDRLHSLLHNPSNLPILPGGGQVLLFHLSKPKAAALKSLATAPPQPGSSPVTISTFNAIAALLLRTVTRLRLPHYPPLQASAPTYTPLFITSIDLRRRLHSPPVPARAQHNLLGAAASRSPGPPEEGGITHPTVHDLVAGGSSSSSSSSTSNSTNGTGDGVSADDNGWSLSQTAAYVRQLVTASGTEERVSALLEGVVARARDKTALGADAHALPALTVWVTDHRGVCRVPVGAAGDGDGGGANGAGEAGGGGGGGTGGQESAPRPVDFGFGRVLAYRQIWGRADVGVAVLYDARDGDEEGYELTVAVERVVAGELVEDEEWARWFEFRGMDCETEG